MAVTIILILGGFFAWSCGRSMYYFWQSGQLFARVLRYEHFPERPTGQILIVGGSAMVGVGAEAPDVSLPGYLGRHFSRLSVINRAQIGARAAEVAQQLSEVGGVYDLVIVHIGSNDVLRWTTLHVFRENLTLCLQRALEKSRNVILFSGDHPANIRALPIPIRILLFVRMRYVQKYLREQILVLDGQVHYVDVTRQLPRVYYAADLFHLNDRGYYEWFLMVCPKVERFF